MNLSRGQLIALATAPLLLGIAVRLPLAVMPDAEASAVSEHVLVGSRAENALQFATQNRFDLRSYSDGTWQAETGARSYPNPAIAEGLVNSAACAEVDCQFSWAERADYDGLVAQAVGRSYRYLWAEAEGKVVALVEDHKLW